MCDKNTNRQLPVLHTISKSFMRFFENFREHTHSVYITILGCVHDELETFLSSFFFCFVLFIYFQMEYKGFGVRTKATQLPLHDMSHERAYAAGSFEAHQLSFHVPLSCNPHIMYTKFTRYNEKRRKSRNTDRNDCVGIEMRVMLLIYLKSVPRIT